MAGTAGGLACEPAAGAPIRYANGKQRVQVYSQKGEPLSAQSINAAGTFTSNTKYYLMDGKAVLDVNDSPSKSHSAGTDLSEHDLVALDAITNLLNNRLRQALNWRWPIQVFAELLQDINQKAQVTCSACPKPAKVWRSAVSTLRTASLASNPKLSR